MIFRVKGLLKSISGCYRRL